MRRPRSGLAPRGARTDRPAPAAPDDEIEDDEYIPPARGRQPAEKPKVATRVQPPFEEPPVRPEGPGQGDPRLQPLRDVTLSKDHSKRKGG